MEYNDNENYSNENMEENQLEEEEKEYQDEIPENINNINNINNNNNIEENNQINIINENEEENQTEGNELMYIYEWVDSIQLSKPKKNISRDFCDGVLFAEIIKNYFPKLVDLHNYPSCSSTKQKLSNWKTLNNKVLKKINFKINNNEINNVINCKPLAIEHLLQKLYFLLQNTFGNVDNYDNGNFNNNNFNNSNLNENNFNVENLRNILNEKEKAVKELGDVIKIFEMKLEGSNNYIRKLEEKVNNLTEKIRSKGYNI